MPAPGNPPTDPVDPAELQALLRVQLANLPGPDPDWVAMADEARGW